MRRNFKLPSLIIGLLAMFGAFCSHASHDQQLQKLLSGQHKFDGVVFEIVSRRSDYLDWAIGEVRRQASLLREKYPNLPIAVVSHSREQFALAKEQRGKHLNMHKQVQSLVGEQSIDVHVCGINAERRGLSQKDFPDYVDVAESGPIQIGLYREMGYWVILITGH